MKTAIWAGLVLLLHSGCILLPRSSGPLAECGSVYPDETAHLAGCTADLEEELYDLDGTTRHYGMRFVYDDLGLYDLIERFDHGELGSWTEWERDEHGEILVQRTEAVDGFLYEDVYERDGRGMVTRLDRGDGSVVQYAVDPDACTWDSALERRIGQLPSFLTAEWEGDRQTFQQVVQGSRVSETRWSYDRDGNETKRVDRVEGRRGADRVESTYDAQGLIIRSTSRGGGLRRDVTWERDELGREVRRETRIDRTLLSTVETGWDGPYPAHTTHHDEEEDRVWARGTWTWSCADR